VAKRHVNFFIITTFVIITSLTSLATEELNINSMLKDLRNEHSDVKIEKKIDKINKNSFKGDLLEFYSQCFVIPAGALVKKEMFVTVLAKYNKQGYVITDSIRLLDTNISKKNKFYNAITESAMRTFTHPQCVNINLPFIDYDQWKDVQITFDFSIPQ